MYAQYLELNELDMLSLAKQAPEVLDMERNWNVPMSIEISD